MADKDYSGPIALALKLITKFGRDVVIEKLSAVPADAGKPWNGPAVPTVLTSVTTRAVFVGVEELSSMGVDEELLKRVTQGCLVPAGATALDDFNSMTDGSVRWGIEFLKALKPGPLTVMYAIGVKR